LINLDFATLRQAFYQRGGKTLFGLGNGSGENAVADAIESLKLCPLLHTPEFSRKADRILVNIVGGTDLTLPKVNEIMTSVTEQFGRDSHVIMGAVIDESMQNQVEVCVLGTTDISGRGVTPRRQVMVQKPKTSTSLTSLPFEEQSRARTVTTSTAVEASLTKAEQPKVNAQAKAKGKANADQDELFTFGEVESRGFFDKTDRNLFEGQDLDVPTYLRKGIKISI
jgi:cell division protein FtsZ